MLPHDCMSGGFIRPDFLQEMMISFRSYKNGMHMTPLSSIKLSFTLFQPHYRPPQKYVRVRLSVAYKPMRYDLKTPITVRLRSWASLETKLPLQVA